VWENDCISYCACFGALKDTEDADLLERVQRRLTRWPELEHGTDEGRLRDRAGSVLFCSAQREGEGKISLLPGEKAQGRWLFPESQQEEERHQLEQGKFSSVMKNNFITTCW